LCIEYRILGYLVQFGIGSPLLLNIDEAEETLQSALNSLIDEHSRTAAGFSELQQQPPTLNQQQQQPQPAAATWSAPNPDERQGGMMQQVAASNQQQWPTPGNQQQQFWSQGGAAIGAGQQLQLGQLGMIGMNQPQMNATNEESIWIQNKFKSLQGLPASFLRFPLPTLLHLNDAIVRDENALRRMEVDMRMTMNAESLMANPRAVAAGWDDRLTRIHNLWFLGGPACSAQALWEQGRMVLGNEGVTALSSFDMDSIGLGGSATAKGWMELANPASKNLQLKLFNMDNISSNVGTKTFSLVDGEDTTISMGESLKEITDMKEFETCLDTVRAAMGWIHPWNKSVEAIWGFMRSTNYCAKELEGRSNRAALLTGFVNYVFGRNALAWKSKGMFLTTDDLRQVWLAWFGRQACSAIEPRANSKKQGESQHQRLQRQKNDLCRRFNSRAGCDKKEEDCRTSFGLKLRHLCNWRLAGGRICEKNHARPDHK